MSQETEPTSPRNLTTSFQHVNDDNGSDEDNERNHNEERSEMKISSQAASTANGTPSSPSSIICEIVRGSNSLTTKKVGIRRIEHN